MATKVHSTDILWGAEQEPDLGTDSYKQELMITQQASGKPEYPFFYLDRVSGNNRENDLFLANRNVLSENLLCNIFHTRQSENYSKIRQRIQGRLPDNEVILNLKLGLF